MTEKLINLKEKLINIPNNIHINYSNNTLIINNNSNFQEKIIIPNSITLTLEGKLIKLNELIKTDNFGTTFSLINQAITGLTKGFKKRIYLIGTGYKAHINDIKNNKILTTNKELKNDSQLILNIGFSHPFTNNIPNNIIIKIINNTIIELSSTSLFTLTSFANILRNLKRPNAYKGTGINYLNDLTKQKKKIKQ